MRQKFLNILFWSIISAAFIGPGTITTAAKAGATHGFSLAWALVFSVIACLVLQEAAARVSIVGKKSLGKAIADQYQGKKFGWLVIVLVVGAIIIGSAAYETGNLLGAASGTGIISSVNPSVWVVVISIVAAVALFSPRLQLLARILGILVVMMGIAFLITAFMVKPDPVNLLKGMVIPAFPAGSGLLVLGLVGTTVVPYNLFLGSGIADKKQTVSQMRFGLAVAIVLGGIISLAVMVVGTSVQGEFTFDALGQALATKIGNWAVWFFGFGLFAAGFSSAITAPLASALTAKDLFQKNENPKWNTHGRYFVFTWGFVLISGLVFGTIGLKPIPAIIAAQALNGLILPFISIFLWFTVNNIKLMGKDGINSLKANLLFGIVIWVTLILGGQNLITAFNKMLGNQIEPGSKYLIIISVIAFLFTLFLFVKVQFLQKPKKA